MVSKVWQYFLAKKFEIYTGKGGGTKKIQIFFGKQSAKFLPQKKTLVRVVGSGSEFQKIAISLEQKYNITGFVNPLGIWENQIKLNLLWDCGTCTSRNTPKRHQICCQQFNIGGGGKNRSLCINHPRHKKTRPDIVQDRARELCV